MMDFIKEWIPLIAILVSVLSVCISILIAAFTIRNATKEVFTLTNTFKQELREDIKNSDTRWALLFEKFHILDKDVEKFRSHSNLDISPSISHTSTN